MPNLSTKCTSKVAAHLEYRLGANDRVYRVELDGCPLTYINAPNQATARKIANDALKTAYNGEWNQTLIFRGDLEPGQVSRTQMVNVLHAMQTNR